MKVECGEGQVRVVAESPEDNAKLQQIGADHDRAMVSVSVTRNPEVTVHELPPPAAPFEPLVIVLTKAEDDIGDMVGNTA